MSNNHKNFAYSTILVAPSPASSGTTITVQPGDGSKFPDCPFNATVWPTGTQPLGSNAEIVLVTYADGDDSFVIERTQEGTIARSIIVGDQIAASITAKTLTNAEGLLPQWSPFILASGAASGLQTLATATSFSNSGSLLVFPVTIPSDMVFNQVILANSYGIVGSASTGSNTYLSQYGLYSRNGNDLSLISQSSFSIGESLNNHSVSWNYPKTTATAGWTYGGFPVAVNGSTHYSALVGGLRSVGIQFGGNVSVSGGLYWLALMSQRTPSAGASAWGLSHAGIIGQPINVINQVGSVNGIFPIGTPVSSWSAIASNITAWWGRHIVGLVNHSIASFGGTGIPSNIPLSAFSGDAAGSTVTILPTVTFVST